MTGPGIIRVDKPEGPTSHDVVAAVRRSLGERRVGHTGTLDPFATGLLLVCVGRSATRLASLLTDLPKRYSAVARLGVETTTDDRTGEVTMRTSTDDLDPAAVRAALEAMRGPLMQTPPAFSAKKVQGRRAYASARAGVEVDLAPVPVVLHDVVVTDVSLPDVAFEVECSSGTYVRAIARDLGRELGVGGHLVSLRRTGIGPHRVEGAVSLDAVGDPDRVESAWMSPLDAVAHLARVDVGDADAERIRHGMSVRCDGVFPGAVAVVHGGELLAIGRADGQAILPKKVLG